ncbi:hypothetical protein LINPERPRIM_LOCUS44083 [Linum perenne]
MYVMVMILCVAYLGVVTIITLKYGPSSRPLDIKIPHMAVQLNLTDEGHPEMSFKNMSIFHFTNHKDHLNITIWFVEALFLYRGVPVTCLFGESQLKLTGQSEKAGEMKEVYCSRRKRDGNSLPEFPFGKEMISDARTAGRVQMMATLSVHAGYSHRPLGYWEVLYRPVCSQLVISLLNRGGVVVSNSTTTTSFDDVKEDKRDMFVGIGTLSCTIADPLWVK